MENTTTSEEKSFLGNTIMEERSMKSNGKEESTSMEINKVISFTYFLQLIILCHNGFQHYFLSWFFT